MNPWKAVVFFAAVCQVGFAAAPLEQNLTKSEADRMAHTAKTPEQYHALASYFRAQQINYQQQADAEKAEWQRRESVPSALAMKYPRPVDSSRNRYEYFAYESGQMGEKAAYYEGLVKAAR
jgi:hypothetical protein